MNSCSWNLPIDKLMMWRASSWINYNAKFSNLLLRVHYDQLLITTTDSKILETFNMRHKMKGIFKEDILILLVSDANHEIRKIKFRVKLNAAQCVQKLGELFPVINYNGLHTNEKFSSKYRNINDILKCVIENKENIASVNLPPAYNDFIKLCLLDPTFPKMVSETENILINKFDIKK